MPPDDPDALLAAARDGDRAATARLLSLVERGGAGARTVSRLSHPLAGHAYTVGLTGAPGAGKSTLTSALISHLRAEGARVGVLAIDPSSPFSGGAILGDRVRMGTHVLDPQVFIRSMATRGHLGGLALAALEAIRVLDAVGNDWVLVETVGVGQVEVDVVGAADTTVVVVNPGWGDAVQANKAGLMEVADVFAINKADRPGEAETRHDLEAMLDLSVVDRSGADGWRPPVVATTASTGEGVADLLAAVGRHRRHLEADGRLAVRREQRLRDELALVVTQRLRQKAEGLLGSAERERLEDAVVGRRLDPWSAADEVLAGLDA